MIAFIVTTAFALASCSPHSYLSPAHDQSFLIESYYVEPSEKFPPESASYIVSATVDGSSGDGAAYSSEESVQSAGSAQSGTGSETEDESENAIADFIAAVGLLGTFDPTTDLNDEYKTKTERARELYGKIPSDRTAAVEEYYLTLCVTENGFTDAEVVAGFIEEFSSLSAYAQTAGEAERIIACGTLFSSLTSEQKELIPLLSARTAKETEAALNDLFAASGIVTPVYKFERSLEDNLKQKRKEMSDGVTQDGVVAIDFSAWTLATAPYGNGDYNHAFQSSYPNAATVTGLKAGGRLEIYAQAYGGSSVTIALGDESATVGRATTEPAVFTLADGGDYEFTFDGGARVYAVIVYSDPVFSQITEAIG